METLENNISVMGIILFLCIMFFILMYPYKPDTPVMKIRNTKFVGEKKTCTKKRRYKGILWRK